MKNEPLVEPCNVHASLCDQKLRDDLAGVMRESRQIDLELEGLESELKMLMDRKVELRRRQEGFRLFRAVLEKLGWDDYDVDDAVDYSELNGPTLFIGTKAEYEAFCDRIILTREESMKKCPKL